MTAIGTLSKRRVFTRQDVTSTSPGFPSSTRRALTMASQCSGSMFQPFPFGALADRKVYARPAVLPLPRKCRSSSLTAQSPLPNHLPYLDSSYPIAALAVADELITFSPQSYDFFFLYSVARFQGVIGPNAQPKIPCMASTWICWRTLAKGPH